MDGDYDPKSRDELRRSVARTLVQAEKNGALAASITGFVVETDDPTASDWDVTIKRLND